MESIFLKVKKSSVLQAGKQYPLNPGTCSVGRRREDNFIVIPEKGVSRNHFSLSVENDGTLSIEDLGSGNGTFVNGKKISGKTSLKSRDVIQAGDTLLEVVVPGKKAAAAPPPPKRASKAAPRTSRASAAKKNLPRIPLKPVLGIAGALVLILLVWKFVPFKTREKSDFPRPEDCTRLYIMPEVNCKFMHPKGFRRLKKDKRSAFGYTYFDFTSLFFGTRYQDRDVIFAVNVLEGMPEPLTLEMVARSDGKDFPRDLPHGKEYVSVENVNVAGHEALLCQSPVFTIGGKRMLSAEVFFLDRGRRFLLMGFTTETLFPRFKPVFLAMVNSFRVDSYEPEIKRPTSLRVEVRRLLKAADSLVERKNIKMENLYLSLKNYRHAIMILNLYDFRPDDKLRAEILEKFKKTEKMLNARIRDLRFRIGKSLKIGETRSLYEAAKEIMNLIPDPENQHYQYAQKYFLRYRDKYEDKFALGRR